MTLESGLLFGGITCILCIMTFVFTRLTQSRKDGHEWGAFQAELKTDVSHIKDDVSEIKTEVKIMRGQYLDVKTDVEVVKRDLKTAFSKIDDIKAR